VASPARFSAAFAAAQPIGRKSCASTVQVAPSSRASLPTPWLGLIERANLGTYLGWIVVLSARLLIPRNRCAVTQPRRKIGARPA